MKVKHLRIISLTEGISYILLLFVGMPLKYLLATPLPNKILGMGHGLLTLVFVAILYLVWLNKKVSFKLALKVFIASLIPFGALYMDNHLKTLD